MKIGEDIPRIPAGEYLLSTGLLFEINRKILHPLGLALEVMVENEDSEAPSVVLGDLRDYSHDPEGVIFGDLTFSEGIQKLKQYMEEVGGKRLETRRNILGYVVQNEQHDFYSKKHKTVVKDTFVSMHEDVDVTEESLKIESVNPSEESLSVAERNMAIRARKNIAKGKTASMKQGVASDVISNTPHNTPTGEPCDNPAVSVEPLSAGGSLKMCSTCGATLRDPDLEG